MQRSRILVLAGVVLAMGMQADAALITYSSKGSFLADTGASSATGALPEAGAVGPGFTVGSVSFTTLSGQLFMGTGGLFPTQVTDWSASLPGSDIAISGVESFQVDLAAPVYLAGLRLLRAERLQHRLSGHRRLLRCVFRLNLPGDLFPGRRARRIFHLQRARRHGGLRRGLVRLAFDRVEITDLTTTIDDDYWGDFYTADHPGAGAWDGPSPGEADSEPWVCGGDARAASRRATNGRRSRRRRASAPPAPDERLLPAGDLEDHAVAADVVLDADEEAAGRGVEDAAGPLGGQVVQRRRCGCSRRTASRRPRRRRGSPTGRCCGPRRAVAVLVDDPVAAARLVGDVVHHRELRVADDEELDLRRRRCWRRLGERAVGDADGLAVVAGRRPRCRCCCRRSGRCRRPTPPGRCRCPPGGSSRSA